MFLWVEFQPWENFERKIKREMREKKRIRVFKEDDDSCPY